jgi:hypothetical protein
MPRIRIDIPVLLLTTALVALATLSTTAVRFVTANEALTFQASVDYSGTQGYRGWSYRDSTGALLTYDTARRLWRGREEYLLLWPAGGHPGLTLGAMRRWTAPQAGSIRVTGTVRDGDTRGGDGVGFVIRKNGSVLWQQTIANGNTTGVSFNLALSVAQNDTLDFIVNRGPANNSWDSTQYDAVITYGTWSEPTVVADGTTDSSSYLPPPAPAVDVSELHERLLGPVVPLAQWTDPIEQTAAARLAGKPVNFLLTEPANSDPNYEWLGPNYYDRIAWAYRYAAASGRQDILDRARFYAREVSQNDLVADWKCQAVTPSSCATSGPANRDNQPRGIAMAATDGRDPATQAIAIEGLARHAAGGWRAISPISSTSTRFIDPRENGNGLLALSLSHAVGGAATPAAWGVSWNSAARAKTMLDTILAAQKPWGCWSTIYVNASGHYETPVYMQGLTLAGLQAYADFVQNDSRIVPAVQRCVEWLRLRYRPGWSTGGWVYSYDADGATVLNGNVYPTLSGMLIGPIGWLWTRTGDARWHSLADDAFAALVQGGSIFLGKEANQWARAIVNWVSTR